MVTAGSVVALTGAAVDQSIIAIGLVSVATARGAFHHHSLKQQKLLFQKTEWRTNENHQNEELIVENNGGGGILHYSRLLDFRDIIINPIIDIAEKEEVIVEEEDNNNIDFLFVDDDASVVGGFREEETMMRIMESIRGGGGSGSASTMMMIRRPDSHQEQSTLRCTHHRQSLRSPAAQQDGGYIPSSPRRKKPVVQQPPPPKEVPLRFIRAAKGDPHEAKRRYQQTLSWRTKHRMDTILFEPHPNFTLIKQNYLHYYHLRGRQNEPVYYEFPPQTNLKALRNGGVNLTSLLQHYAMVNEFGWQYIERNDMATSLYIIDLRGVKVMDFVGDVVKFVRLASQFTKDHYPERCGTVMVLNVPSWFKIIWKVVRPMVDEVTLRKIYVLRGKDEIFNALSDRIPIDNIPPEYGGNSMPLGDAPEEQLLWDLMDHNNKLATYNEGDDNGEGRQPQPPCNGLEGDPPCPFCSFVRARSY